MQAPGTDNQKIRARPGRHPPCIWQHSGVFGQGVLTRPRAAVLDPAHRGSRWPPRSAWGRWPPVVLVRRGRDDFGVLQSLAGAAMADVGQRRRRPRPVLRAHARLVHDLRAHGILVARAKRSGSRGCGGRCRGAGQAVLVSHRRAERGGHLRDPAPGDMGRYRSPAVRTVDDGRRVVDRTVRSRRTPRQRLDLAVLRGRTGGVDSARRVPRADVVGARRFPVFLPAGRAVVVRFGITSVCACLAVAPFVRKAVGQAHQIIWISPVGRRTIEDVAVQQYFERSPLFLIVSALRHGAAVILWRFTSAQLAEPDRQLLPWRSRGWWFPPR